MAEETENYPRLPAKHWWTIRERLKRSVPAAITPAYIESALAVEQATARELVTQLQYLKLIDNDARPTDIAEDWRHDDTYAKACHAILNAVYPEELRHAADTDRAAAQRWFARRKKVGENAALKMAITYQLVVDADLKKAPDATNGGAPKPKPERREARAPARKGATSGQKGSPGGQIARREGESEANDRPKRDGTPALHIDVQIHIASDASAAQIDQIFASMSKHLYGRVGASE